MTVLQSSVHAADLREAAGRIEEWLLHSGVQPMELQAPDGTLPETIRGGLSRSDVLAQPLRVGLLLRLYLRAREHALEPVALDRSNSWLISMSHAPVAAGTPRPEPAALVDAG